MPPWDAMDTSLNQTGMLQNLWPPQDQPRRFEPKGMRGPLRVQDVDGVASAAQGFSFRPPALGELVDADDVPIFANTFNPFHIRRGGFEQIAEVINAGDILLAAAAQLANRVCQIRRQVVVKQEVHAASRCSNSTAARTA